MDGCAVGGVPESTKKYSHVSLLSFPGGECPELATVAKANRKYNPPFSACIVNPRFIKPK
jgi:hypothetical protein